MFPALRTLCFCCFFLLTGSFLSAQQVTGVWKGKLNRQRVEVKIIQKGDSLTGTSYYYESAGSYRRYSIRGYFDPATNAVVWWDDRLLEERGLRLTNPGKNALLSTADFNCPGGGEMYLDGKAGPKEETPSGPAHLTKAPQPVFRDEWDFIIDNWTAGTSDPDLIDSVALVAFRPQAPAPKTRRETAPPTARREPGMVAIPAPPEPRPEVPIAAAPADPTDQKFRTRTKKAAITIPVTGPFVELRFYDNAEIDGDSISLYLNDKILFTHVRLTGQPYTIKVPVSDLSAGRNELVMVAENLGSIPPNTAFMVALTGNRRYEARLASSEQMSAMVILER